MKYLVDTHLLLWAGDSPELLSKSAYRVLTEEHDFFFSTVSVWETAIKFGLRRGGFNVEPAMFRRRLLANGYQELPITTEHVIRVIDLPAHHGDPFDRLLVSQALLEGMSLLTSDRTLARYPSTLRV